MIGLLASVDSMAIFSCFVRKTKRLFVLLRRFYADAPVVQWIEYRIPVPTI